ncbi:hypothetical protein F5Y16DRAFT_404513 [Xylariaceae sp. FL0255]|nr:hypothetical protein F5Y16DRAFT_404513 [Xylariaceae sp. FL0255]
MVGVPKRSKACSTCRRRRKCCDEKRPFCGQCTLSRIPCGGYDQDRIFINSSEKHATTENKQYRFKPAAYSAANSSSSLSTSFAPVNAVQTYAYVSAQGQISSPVLHTSLERTAHETKCLEVYWTSLLPYGQAFPPQAASYSTTGWTGAIQELYQRNPLVRTVLLASGLTLTAQRTGCQSLMAQGRRLYGSSLQMMAYFLEHKKLRHWDSILAASGALAGYELLVGTDEQTAWLSAPTWLRHTSGEVAIMLAGGPESFTKGHGHQFFVDYRLHLIFPYLQNRKRCPLSSVEWKTIPWSIHPKSHKDQLIDVLVELPGILEDIETLETLSNQPEKQLLFHDLEERSWWCDSQLLSWSTSCGEDVVTFIEKIIAVPNLEDVSVASAPLSIDLAKAHLGMIYWTTYNMVSQILSWVRAANPSKEKTALLPPRLDAHMYSRKVALLIPYFKNPGVGSYLVSFIGFPVTVAASFLLRQSSAETSSEARALLIKAFRGEQGKRLQDFLASWPWTTRAELETLGLMEHEAAVDQASI